MNILVLEDDLAQQGRMETTIRAILREKHYYCRQFELFAKPSLLLEAVREKGSHHLFFLDIDIKGEEQKGFDVAMAIRAKDPHANIVFVTTHSEFMPITFRYKIAALDFIDKAQDDRNFRQQLETCIDHVAQHQRGLSRSETFVFETAQAQLQVPFAEIYYIETSPMSHKLILHTKYERLEFYGKLSELVKADNRLYHCHRSFVVNPMNIRKIDKSDHMVYFENGASCYVSRRHYKSLLEKVAQIRQN